MNKQIDFIESTESFAKNLNNSLIERGQWIDSFEILLDKMMDYQSTCDDADCELRRLQSMLEVLIKAMKYAQSMDEDLARGYEKKYLKPYLEALHAKGREDE